MSGEAVTKRVRRNVLGNSGPAYGVVKHREDVVAGERLIRSFSGKEPVFRFGLSPVLPQGIEQNRGQHDHAILLSFPLDGDGHVCRVDVTDSQASYLGAP